MPDGTTIMTAEQAIAAPTPVAPAPAPVAVATVRPDPPYH